MTREKSCCFSGHRALPREERPAVEAALEREIENLICRGVVDFLAGGALGFDTMAAKAVLRVKEHWPKIRLSLILPCKDQDKNWAHKDKEEYRRLLAYADEVTILTEHYQEGCMQLRNRYMVDESQYLICYHKSKTGGTAYTVRYAKEKNREIINLSKLETGLF